MTESYECGPTLRVDRKKGVIYNVLVLGRKARNGRRYTDEAMEEALGRNLYERLQVYIGPHLKRKDGKRSPHNHAGELRGAYKAKDGIRVKEFHVNRESQGGKLAMEIAERFPNSFGLSHHSDVAGYEDEYGEKVVTRILEVAVADIVKDAATTDGIFEEVEMSAEAEVEIEEVGEEGEVAAADPPDPAGDTGGSGWQASVKQLIADIHDDDSIEDDTKMQATKLAMKLKKLLAGDSSEDDDDAGDDTPSGEEEVDLKTLIKRLKAVEESQKRKTSRPKSAARSTVTEEVDPKKAAPKAKDKPPKKLDDILAAYDGEDDEDD